MKIATQIILLFYFCECFGQGVSNAYSARALINDNRYAEAIQVIGDCVEVPCLIELGFCYQKLGNFKKSTNYYLQALEANPNNQTTIFQLSQNFERLGNYTKSKSYYENLISLDSTNVLYYKLYGNLLVKVGMDSLAIKSYKRTIYLNPADLESTTELGKLYFKTNSFQECKRLVNKGLKSDSTYIPLLQLNAKLSYRDNNFKEAVTQIQQIMSAGDSTLFYQRLLGFSYSRLDSTQKAIETLERYAIKGEPNELVHYYLGLCYLKTSDTKKAKENLEKAIKIGVSENVTDYFYMLGYLEETGKNYKEAIDLYQKAYTFDPRPDLLFMIARSYDWGNNKFKAIELYQKYLASKSKTFAEDAKKRLQQIKK